MYSPRQKILWFAVISRCFIIILQTISNLLLPDHNAGVFLSPEDPALKKTLGDRTVDLFLGGLKRWDAHYFIHIAQYGYTHENCLAFFPLFPLLVRYTAYPLNLLLGSVLNIHSLLLISALLVNFFSFIKAVDVLHSLSLRIFKSESRAYKACILFCVNPASIFFVAPYSESLFAWMTFYTIYKCTEIETLRFTNIDITSSIPVGFSMLTRSNGMINFGFILYALFKNTLEKTFPQVYNKYKSLNSRVLLPFLLLPLFASIMSLLLCIIISFLPYCLVQLYNYYKFCLPHDHNLPKFLINKDYILPGSAFSPWCNYTIPISYPYIQSHYWNVGLFKYYKLKQIPNFILAAPVLSILIYNCIIYIKNNLYLCLRLGVKTFPTSRQYTKLFGITESLMFVYIVHALFLSIFCLLCVHVQISTRFLCSSTPMFYWICSGILNIGPTPTADQNTINEHFRRIGMNKRIPSHHLSIANLEGVGNMYSKWKTFIICKNMSDRKSRCLQLYYLGYLLMGTVCFSNFLPWT